MSRDETDAHAQRPQPLRGIIYIAVAVQVALWIAAIGYIAWHTNRKGDGMEWAAVAPATVIVALGIAPPLVVLRRYPGLLWFGVLLAIAGVLLMAGIVFEITRELG
ncbi:MAG: hypothetical protein KGI48_11590 [Hyphomicrobiales bacterium]|nr:hypothetical protein [Hyphomicrobiales bacterium]